MVEVWTPETLRAFEEEVRGIYRKGRIRAPVHLSRGNEKQLIEVFKVVGPDDWVFSTYRSHYHALMKQVPREDVMAAILAGKSIHLSFPKYRFYTSAIVAGNLPIALGVALGLKRRGEEGHVWVFSGDMAAQGGSFHEATQYASGFDLPITFVIECNALSTNSPTYDVWGKPHAHAPEAAIQAAGRVLSYCYDREWPHYGVGEWVNFDDPPEASREERADVMA